MQSNIHPISIVPDNWASIEITTDGEPLHGNNYTLICSVKTMIEGINLPIEVHWDHSDGLQFQRGGRLRVGSPVTNGNITTLRLNFSRLLHDDGGNYTCRASVTLPGMTTQPVVKNTTMNVVVTSKAGYRFTQV